MWAEIASIYRVSKKKKDINWWTEWVCRPPAAVFVYLLRNTPITPNQVTILSVLVCAGAGAMFVTLPGHLWVVLAALVFELSFVLDCVDGQLARLRKIASPLGHLFDFLMDEIKAMLIFGCIAIRLWRGSADDLYLWAGLAGLFALASGINPDGTIPKDNPFVGTKDARADVWSYGHRNMLAPVVEPSTGRLYVFEMGPQGGDELNVITPGKNYGWPLVSN